MSMVVDVSEKLDLAVEGSGLQFVEKERIHQGLIEVVLEILRSLNQIAQEAVQEDDPGQPEVIFKKVTQGGCFTLLYSAEKIEEPAAPEAAPAPLSPREQEIVRLTSHGLSNKAIAAVLDISPWTVNTYIRRIFTKLNVNTRAEMVAVAARARQFTRL